MNACYWIEWIIQFESACNSRKEYLKCQAREKMPVMTAYQKEVIWIVWSALLKEAGNRHQLIKKIVDSLLNLFTLKYKEKSSGFRTTKIVNYKKARPLWTCIFLPITYKTLDSYHV